MVLPRFTAPDLSNLQSSFAQSATMQSADPTALARWQFQLSHIRPAMRAPRPGASGKRAARRAGHDRLTSRNCRRWRTIAGSGCRSTRPRRQQAAVSRSRRWRSATRRRASTFAGLLVDEWLEQIPATKTTAGLSFHYDEPRTRAPQALLLAVCPDKRETWDLGLVQAILEETLALTKTRTVDLDSIQQVGTDSARALFSVQHSGRDGGHSVPAQGGCRCRHPFGTAG